MHATQSNCGKPGRSLESEVYTRAEAARIVKVSEPTINAAIRDGRLKAFDIGTRRGRSYWRITRPALLDWLSGQNESDPGSKETRT